MDEGVSNPGSWDQVPISVGAVTPIDPGGTPSITVTPTMPQQITASIPTGGTRVQKTVVATNAAGVATWTFPTAFVGSPSIAVVCEGDTTNPANAQVTAISNTAVTVKVFKQSTIAVALIGLSVQVLAGSPGVTNVHIYAAPNPS